MKFLFWLVILAVIVGIIYWVLKEIGWLGVVALVGGLVYLMVVIYGIRRSEDGR